jgi:hypothetical protein
MTLPFKKPEHSFSGNPARLLVPKLLLRNEKRTNLPPGISQVETSAKTHFVILSAAKDLVLTCNYEILRSLRSLRMTGKETFAELSS